MATEAPSKPTPMQLAAISPVSDTEVRVGRKITGLPTVPGFAGREVEWKRSAIDRAFLVAAVETSDDAVIGKSLYNGRIIHWNRGAERLYGWTAKEIIGEPFSILVPDDKRAEWDINQDFLAALSEPSIVLETVRLHKCGTRIDVSVRVAVVRDPRTGEPIGLCSIARDITARKTAERGHDHAQDQDKKIALALQRALLFKPDENAFPGLSVQTAYATASEEALVGGDFWDTFAFNNEHVALVIGDVMGHGLSSAIFTNELKYTMRAYIREHIEPAAVLYHMNEYLCQSNRLFLEGVNTEGSDSPVCIALAIIVRKTGKGTLATAAMEPSILVRANGETEQSETSGIPLGVREKETFKQVDFQLEVGDTLILTTDGITEARSGRDFLNAEGLMRLAAAANGGPLKAMADAILNGAQEFAGGYLHDDASLVLVRRAAE